MTDPKQNPEPTFTQADVDRAIQAQLAKVTAKYHDYNAVKEKAFVALSAVLDQADARNDVVVAALNGIRLLRPDATPAGESLRKRALETCSKFLERPDVREKLLAQGAEAAPSSAAELDGIVKDELRKWEMVIREAKIKPE